MNKVLRTIGVAMVAIGIIGLDICVAVADVRLFLACEYWAAVPTLFLWIYLNGIGLLKWYAG